MKPIQVRQQEIIDRIGHKDEQLFLFVNAGERKEPIGKKPIGAINLEEFIEMTESNNPTLILSLKKQWFDIMKTGQKSHEFRMNSEWIKSRLFDREFGGKKEYAYVRFINGYQKGAKEFTCKFNGFFVSKSKHIVSYGDLKVVVNPGDYVIKLGDIIEVND